MLRTRHDEIVRGVRTMTAKIALRAPSPTWHWLRASSRPSAQAMLASILNDRTGYDRILKESQKSTLDITA